MTWIRRKARGFWNSIKNWPGKLFILLKKVVKTPILFFMDFIIILVYSMLWLWNRVLTILNWVPLILILKFVAWLVRRRIVIRILKLSKKFAGIWNLIEKWFLSSLQNKRFYDRVFDELVEEVLIIGIKTTNLYSKLDPEFSKIFEDFKATYVFRGSTKKIMKKSIAIVAEFKEREVVVIEIGKDEDYEKIKADVTLFFSNGKALIYYLLAAKKDMLKAMLNNELVISGNLNFAMKFMYIFNHFLLVITGRVS